jgi:hypothetical protein
MARNFAWRTAAALAASIMLSACVESQVPLITDARPLLGEQFEVHLYENFVDGKASDFHSSTYRWVNGQYERGNGLARDAKRFVAQPLAGSDFLIQSTDDEGKVYYYWIGRKLAVGVYTIFALNEADADKATQDAICGVDHPKSICRVQKLDQLVTLAKATAAQPIRESALGVVLTK